MAIRISIFIYRNSTVAESVVDSVRYPPYSLGRIGDRAKGGAESWPANMAERNRYSASMFGDSSQTTSVLQLRVSLRGVSPPVWRRLLIPEKITIAQLHHVMQFAMGWNDEHLHQFIIRGWRYGVHRDGAPSALTAATFDSPGTEAALTAGSKSLSVNHCEMTVGGIASRTFTSSRTTRPIYAGFSCAGRRCARSTSNFPIRWRRHRAQRPDRFWRLCTRLVSRRHAGTESGTDDQGTSATRRKALRRRADQYAASGQMAPLARLPYPALSRLESLGWELDANFSPGEARLLARLEEFIGYLENN